MAFWKGIFRECFWKGILWGAFCEGHFARGILERAFWDGHFLIFLWRNLASKTNKFSLLGIYFCITTPSSSTSPIHQSTITITNKEWCWGKYSAEHTNLKQKWAKCIVCCYFFLMWAPPCALETADHLQRQRSHQAIHYPSQVGPTKLCPYIPSIIDPVDECSLSQTKIYWPSKNNISVPKRNDNFSNWNKGDHVKVKPITNKTENPSKDAPDRSESYAKWKLCKIPNYAKCKTMQKAKLCTVLYL